MLADRTRRVAQAANLRDSAVDPELLGFAGPTANRQPPTANRQPPTAHPHPPTPNRQRPTADANGPGPSAWDRGRGRARCWMLRLLAGLVRDRHLEQGAAANLA